MIEFSAVVHTYNRAAVLLNTLESVRNQSYPAVELIVVDDGSTDDTEAVVREKFPEFRYLRIANTGCGAARKAGAEAATKPWIAFCDDDDLWQERHLRARAALIERFPEAGFTCANFRAFGPAADPHYVHFSTAPAGWWVEATASADGPLRLLKSDAYLHCLRWNPAFPLVWAVRRDIYWRVGGINPRYSRWPAEDTDFFRRCLLVTRLACDMNVSALYQRHGGNMSGSKVRNFVGRAKILDEHLSADIVPEAWRAAVVAEAGWSRREACLLAFWQQDYAIMSSLYHDVPREWRDLGLLARWFAAWLRRFGRRSRRCGADQGNRRQAG